MLHPLFSTLVQRPDLVANHVAAYAELFHDEATRAGSELVARLFAWVIAAITFLIFMGLSGTALMLGAIHGQFHWALVAVPGSALLALLVSLGYARKPLSSERFPELRAQIDSDARALRSAI